MKDINHPTQKVMRKTYESMSDDDLKDIYKWFRQQQTLIRNVERRRKKNKKSMDI